MNKRKFLRWVGNQPVHRTFDYINPARCLFATFLKETDAAHRDFRCIPGKYRVVGDTMFYFRFPEWAVKIDRVLASSRSSTLDIGHVLAILDL